jgi:hypothetical protein
VLDLVNEKRSRLKCKTGGEEAGINWGNDVLKKFRQLRSSTGEGSELRASLGTRSFSPFFESWEPVSDRYKDLLEFCDMVACVLPTTSAFKANFSPLSGAKTVYRANLSCLGLEGVMQASGLMLIAGKVDVPFKFPTIPNWPVCTLVKA